MSEQTSTGDADRYYKINLDALAQQVNTLREVYESAFNDPKSDASETQNFSANYMEANNVLMERLKAGEKFADDRTSRATLTKLYEAMDLSELGDLASQFRSILTSMMKAGTKAEQYLWERRLMCAQDVLNERTNVRQAG
ncbi:MAG: hypothetical protein ACKVOE_09670 [Rickettsiales bacterium]